MNEFAGVPLAVGSVFGVRQWQVHKKTGTLTGLSYALPWSGEENHAICGGRASFFPAWIHSSLGPSLAHINNPGCPGIASPNCSCGFYAYYDHARWNLSSGIKGVIEGYGSTTLGTRGFRCEKARIVALCIPKPGHNLWDRYCLWSNDHDGISIFLGAPVAFAGLVLGIGSIAAGIGGWLWPLVAVAALLVVFGVASVQAVFRGIDLYYDTECDHRLDKATAARIRRNYPNAQIFTDYDEMLQAFPLSEPESTVTPPAHLWRTGGGAA